jgi:hypothetical protein
MTIIDLTIFEGFKPCHWRKWSSNFVMLQIIPEINKMLKHETGLRPCHVFELT